MAATGIPPRQQPTGSPFGRQGNETPRRGAGPPTGWSGAVLAPQAEPGRSTRPRSTLFTRRPARALCALPQPKRRNRRQHVPPHQVPRGRAPWARRGALLACGWFVALGRRSRASVCSLSASNRVRGVQPLHAARDDCLDPARARCLAQACGLRDGVAEVGLTSRVLVRRLFEPLV